MPKKKDQMQRITREMERDLRKIESIHWLAQWMNARDSNCGNAASMTDAIEVLAARAIELYKEELDLWKSNKGAERK